MSKRIFGTVAILIAGISSAHAADLPAQESTAPSGFGQPFNWTGPYVGVNAGFGFSGADQVHSDGQAAPNIANIQGGARPGLVDLQRRGAMAGGQIGYNYQYERYVAGIEADIDYTDFRDVRDIGTAQLNTGLALRNRFRSDIDYIGTVRGRFGVTYDRALFYATGGMAYGRTQHKVTMFGPLPDQNLQFEGGRIKTQIGYTVGGGVEYGITGHVSAKAEYLYYNLGRETVNVAVLPDGGGAGTGYNSHFKDSGNIVRVGLNYKF
jgi:outer membrane immunogenic protein